MIIINSIRILQGNVYLDIDPRGVTWSNVFFYLATWCLGINLLYACIETWRGLEFCLDTIVNNIAWCDIYRRSVTGSLIMHMFSIAQDVTLSGLFCKCDIGKIPTTQISRTDMDNLD
jgi:hypothetical protein